MYSKKRVLGILIGMASIFWFKVLEMNPQKKSGVGFDSTKQLYESAPFPNIGLKNEKHAILIGKNFCKGLGFDPIELKGKRILVAGCGTGEHALGIALAFHPREVVGIDLSEKSLQIASQNRAKLGVSTVSFLQANIFELPFEKNSFDCVVCEGVLHHTPNPKKAFKCLVEVTKKGGLLIIGVYSAVGRLRVRLERFLVDRLAKTALEKERLVKKWHGNRLGREKIFDTYINPIIQYYFVGDLLDWFEKNGIQYVGSYYPFEIKRTFQAVLAKLKKQDYFFIKPASKKPGFLDLLLTQGTWMFTGQFMIRAAGRKQ